LSTHAKTFAFSNLGVLAIFHYSFIPDGMICEIEWILYHKRPDLRKRAREREKAQTFMPK